MSDLLRILVADDDPIALRMTTAYLRRKNQVIEARDGLEAVEAFKAQRPDVVVLDVQMPRMTGPEAAAQMRELAGDHFVPILLVSGMDEVETMVAGLAMGADDFLPKPFNPRVFESKLAVFRRIASMQDRLREQNRQLARFHDQVSEEHAVAKRVFEKILHRGSIDDPRIRVEASPLAMFNGDVVLVAETPDGRLRWMLGDVSGHGLSGALGTVPLAGVFFNSTAKGVDFEFMLRTMNTELKSLLPSTHFCAAAAMELDPTQTELTVWNGGLPAVFVRDGATRGVFMFESNNVPLGICSDAGFTVNQRRHTVAPGDRVLAMSDGIVEATSSTGELFGLERVLAALAEPGDASRSFDALDAAVRAFSIEQNDDRSAIEVCVQPSSRA